MQDGRRVVLHVGAMKTATTYLQNLLAAHAAPLSDAGWHVPHQPAVARATRELVALDGYAVTRPPVAQVPSLGRAPLWVGLVDDLRDRLARPGTVGAVVSMEFLSFLRPAGAAQVVDGFAGLDPTVLLTVRDLQRALPSQWSTLVLNGYAHSWADFAVGVRAVVAGRPSPAGRPFTRTQDLPRMVGTWAEHLTADRLVVVTVPGAATGHSRDEVWRRVASVLGVDPAVAPGDVDDDNPQLGHGTSELLRLVNGHLGGRTGPSRRKVVRRLVREHLQPLREQQGRPRLDEETARVAVDLNRRTWELAARRTTVVGEAGDLPPTAAPGDHDPGDRPAAPPAEEVWDAAHAVVRGAAELCRSYGHPAAVTDLGGDLGAAVPRVAAAVEAAVEAHADHRRRRRAEWA